MKGSGGLNRHGRRKIAKKCIIVTLQQHLLIPNTPDIHKQYSIFHTDG